ncbi:uncharacterized protein LOC112904218 isoform X2 [Agrilus planipennis]|uniref:Uncharacterized protein LOC112904218 isoform X2 n=1 Tax=Agrilus planipennis TaxID=224129 RepID=A0A7F5QWJ5_AGRPL|nr:uncharacterized protein LOC112904218 isoform X2 [Agrilus planipennis]
MITIPLLRAPPSVVLVESFTNVQYLCIFFLQLFCTFITTIFIIFTDFTVTYHRRSPTTLSFSCLATISDLTVTDNFRHSTSIPLTCPVTVFVTNDDVPSSVLTSIHPSA